MEYIYIYPSPLALRLRRHLFALLSFCFKRPDEFVIVSTLNRLLYSHHGHSISSSFLLSSFFFARPLAWGGCEARECLLLVFLSGCAQNASCTLSSISSTLAWDRASTGRGYWGSILRKTNEAI